MQKYINIPMVAGPVSLHPNVLKVMNKDYGSGQIEKDFIPFYSETADMLAEIMQTKNEVVLMTGEGMLALWGALKSCLKVGDKVLSIGTGVFGDGIGEMAKSLGCEVTSISLPYNQTIDNMALELIEEALKKDCPKLISVVHCETPSGTLNPLDGLAALKNKYKVPLLYVDAVASVGGAALNADALSIDLALVGSQKCLSAPPSMSIVSVSSKAFEIMEEINYQGYDSLLPFKNIKNQTRCPYTPYWHGVAALNAAAKVLLDEGINSVYARHNAVAEQCRTGIEKLGLELFVEAGFVSSPTVTAIKVPQKTNWETWKKLLRAEGLVVSGSFGPMQDKVFRLGHMGTQADEKLMSEALKAIERSLKKI
ncbi:pyridoxal-phosphate-dependent aminotransferase family protein [Desulfovibrio litoralis]|uniref:Aspartate aminotransferase n=1 Tax=Desulfovibrio litoralis DSM 11393 TaxID=1121455 RepID=A0A1M7S834_9BACT|nr:aminotransferase class V-fold PLP-dependent enzyme [Desulfovibrio litoralis]SHN54590.1 aspartate aminotransferase [Desulfovibrio litoralis DSM 11393]